MNFQILAAASHTAPAEGDATTVALANDADALALPLDGVVRVDLHFPNFTDAAPSARPICCAAAGALRATSAPPAMC